jgi:hypothetical protein
MDAPLGPNFFLGWGHEGWNYGRVRTSRPASARVFLSDIGATFGYDDRARFDDFFCSV